LPFISLFSNREHAENWGRKEPWRGRKGPSRSGDWSLHVIDTTKLKDTNRLFELSDLVDELSLNMHDGAVQHILGAFLSLHHVPIEAVVERRNPNEVKEGKCLNTIYKASF
jgi:hypothetical protein